MFAPVITSVWNGIRHLCLWGGGSPQRWMSHCPVSVMLFSFFLLNLELYENAKWSCTCFLFYFLPTLPFNLFYLQGDLDQFQLKHQSVYWRGEKKKSYEIIQNWKLIFPKPAKPLNRWAGMWLQTWWTATRGGSSSWDSHTILPLMWSSLVSGHLRGFRCFGSFHPSLSALNCCCPYEL